MKVSFDYINKQGSEIVYQFSVNEQEQYVITFGTSAKIPANILNSKVYDDVIFEIGMCFFSYVALAFAAKEMQVNCRPLYQEQIEFWQHTYNQVMAEFFYLKNIDLQPLVIIMGQCLGAAPSDLNIHALRHKPSIIPIVVQSYGGGKDTIILNNRLKILGIYPHLFYLEERRHEFNNMQSLHHVANSLAHHSQTIFYFDLDESLTQAAFYPDYAEYGLFACLYVFCGVLVGLLTGANYLVAGNERSANVGNLTHQDTIINHQYEKSFDYELKVVAYLRKFVYPLNYFSGLMDLWEIQIIQLFAATKQYHADFVSCNFSNSELRWCCSCAKCLQIYLLLSAFMPQAEVIAIFGENLLQKSELIPYFAGLVGQADKPLECVATTEENILAAYLILQKPGNEHLYLFQPYKHVINRGATLRYLLTDKGDTSNMPEWFLTGIC